MKLEGYFVVQWEICYYDGGASNIDKNVEMPNIVLRGRRERAVRYGES
ncbi:hypothetical protein GCM10025791_40060 [Halioxenophilus aromaticivorans]|uniref:Uncharacterized protein n=1 Tax=Halioxenophilus aromaticivorans TaxID=1306992 RepID=A0AAV3U7F3_9ALTE